MDGQLDPVEQDIRNIQERIVRYEQKLAVAEQAGNKEAEESLINLLSGLIKLLSGLQEKENVLRRNQTPSKPCLQLVLTGLPVSTSFAFHVVEACIKFKMRINTGCTAQLWGYSP